MIMKNLYPKNLHPAASRLIQFKNGPTPTERFQTMLKSRRHILFAGCIGLALTGLTLQILGVFSRATAQNQAVKTETAIFVETRPAHTGPIAEIREAVGTARAHQSIQISTKVSGIIESISFQEGSHIQAGEVIVRLHHAEQEAEKEKAQAELQKAIAVRDEQARKLERATALQKTGSGAAAQVDDITAQVRALDGAIASARAAIRVADARLDELTIRAPFSGRAGSHNYSVGAYISPGNAITTLDDLSMMRIDFSVPESYLDHLQIGQIVRATSAAYPGREFTGKLAVINPRVDDVSRSVRLTADFDNTDETLKTGMFLSVKLEINSSKEAVLVPEEALINNGLMHFIFVVSPDKRAERRSVTIGQRLRGFAEITNGIDPGEQVIVRGVQRVRPGSLLDPQPLPSEPGTNNSEKSADMNK